jgi:hypothetical protein
VTWVAEDISSQGWWLHWSRHKTFGVMNKKMAMYGM